jgi:hypothetical protein
MDACSATSHPLGKEANSTCFRQSLPTMSQLEGFYRPNHKRSSATARRYGAKDDEVVEALSSMVAAASNRTQENLAWIPLAKAARRANSILPATRQGCKCVSPLPNCGNQNPQGDHLPTTKASRGPEAFDFRYIVMASHWPPVKPSIIPNSPPMRTESLAYGISLLRLAASSLWKPLFQPKLF